MGRRPSAQQRVPLVRLQTASGMLALSAMTAVLVTPVVAQGVGYRLTPGADYVRWHAALGLEEDYLFGGRFGITFGPAVSLQPFYFRGRNLRADPDAIAGSTPFTGLAARDVDVDFYGANIEVNLGSGDIIPFLRGGGGVLRIEPDSLDRMDQIALKAGGGLRFGLDRANVEVFVEDWGFRLDRTGLYGGATPDPEAGEYRHNLVAGAGLSIALGSAGGDVPDAAGGGALLVEPFVGRLEYDDALDLERQNVAGVRAGVDVNSYVGVRGFYWRGVNRDFDRTEDLAGYGGEAQFNLNRGTGLVPYLLAGAARLDYEDGFVNRAGVERPDMTALILGGGVGVQLGEHLRVNVAARNHLLNTATDLQDIARTDELSSNWMFSTGVTFRLGGAAPGTMARRGEAPARTVTAPATSPEVAELRAAAERLRTETELLRRQIADVRSAAVPAEGSVLDVRLRAIERSMQELQAAERAAPAPGTYVTTADLERLELRLMQWLQVRNEPAARQQPPAQQPPVTRQAADTIAVAPGAVQAAPTPAVDMALLERRLAAMEDRIANRIDGVEQRMRTALEQQSPPPTAPVPAAPAGRVIVVAPDTTVVTTAPREPREWSVREIRTYAGLNFDDPTQLVFGGRVDLGGINPGSPILLVPEVAFGFGEARRTVLVAGNLLYSIGSLGGRAEISPYVMLGAGVFSESVLSLNLAYGATFDVDGLGATRHMFIEHQGLNLFERNRLLLGLRFER